MENGKLERRKAQVVVVIVAQVTLRWLARGIIG